MTRRGLAIRIVLFIAVATAIGWAGLNRDQFDLELFDAWLAGTGVWAPLVFVGLYVAATVLFLPGSLFSLAGGAFFGPFWGSILNLGGATIGAGMAFLIARYIAGDWVAQKSGGRLQKMIEGVEAEGWRFVAFVRLVPLFPFNLMNYALGLTRIKFRDYVITSLVCMTPGAVAFTWLGYAGREALSGNSSAIRYGLLALGLLAAIAFIPRIFRRMRGGETPRWIEVTALADQIRTASVKVIDVREPDEFTGPLGHIAAAANLPLAELSDRLIEIRAFKDKPVILVCRTDKRSASAAELLKDAGFRDVRILRGGMEQWNRDGLPGEGGNSGERA